MAMWLVGTRRHDQCLQATRSKQRSAACGLSPKATFGLNQTVPAVGEARMMFRVMFNDREEDAAVGSTYVHGTSVRHVLGLTR